MKATNPIGTSFWVIDDDYIYRIIATKWIQKLNQDNPVLVFENGQEALQAINSGAPLPDIILLDINMPIMDGWEFLDEYANLGPEIRKNTHLYIVSSSIAHSDLERSESHPLIREYLVKPLDQQVLLRITEAFGAEVASH